MIQFSYFTGLVVLDAKRLLQIILIVCLYPWRLLAAFHLSRTCFLWDKTKKVGIVFN